MPELGLKINSRHSVRILIGNGLLAESAEYIRQLGIAGKVIIITDANVGHLYAGKLLSGLTEAGFSAEVITLPAGEEQKNLSIATCLYQEFFSRYCDRSTTVIALGGGVIGDLAGFVAATYLRGLPLVHIPSSLVAQVDSSIGGKVATNLDNFKNQIGTFYHAGLIISDIHLLDSLPEHEFKNGLAEVIKSGAIMDPGLFELLEKNTRTICSRQPDMLEEIVCRSVRVKTELISRDERDTGPRHLLNFGHTVGHGLESSSGLTLNHGEAVAIGMVTAASISYRLGLLDRRDFDRLKKLLENYGLPVNPPKVDPGLFIEALKHDKKIINQKMKFVLLKRPGEAVISHDVTLHQIREAMFS